MTYQIDPQIMIYIRKELNIMRELAVYDYKNYIENGTVGRRPSVRGIIISNGKVAAVHSLKYDYYKLPGGGIDEGESYIETLVREVREEVGLTVRVDTVKEYGVVIRKEKGKYEDLFIQENFYYLCDVDNSVTPQKLDDYENEERFVLEWVDPETFIETNLYHDHKEKDSMMIARHMMEREAKVMKLIMEELM